LYVFEHSFCTSLASRISVLLRSRGYEVYQMMFVAHESNRPGKSVSSRVGIA
jgi:hypothetical protein